MRSTPTGWGHTRGAGGLELVFSIVLGALVMAMGATWILRQQRAVTDSIVRLETSSVLGRSSRLLARELRSGAPGRDWAVATPDSIQLRAFRGRALVCRTTGLDLWVAYRGDRALDPAKDSVLLLDRDAGWVTAHVRRSSAAAGTCHGGASSRWTLDRAVSGSTVARVFERGSYGFGGGALRYRRGGGGRQPLTYARLDTLSRITGGPAHSAVLELFGVATGGGTPGGAPGLVRVRTLRSRGPS